MHRLLLVPLALLLAAGLTARADEHDAADHAKARAGIAKTKIALVDAIATALKKLPGGKAVEAGLALGEGDDEVIFEVEVVADGKHQHLGVDALTGNLEEDDGEAEEGEDETPEELKIEAAALAAKVSLVEAIQAALKAAPGAKAFQAQPELAGGQLVFEVELVSGGKILSVHVDAATGKVLKVDKE